MYGFNVDFSDLSRTLDKLMDNSKKHNCHYPTNWKSDGENKILEFEVPGYSKGNFTITQDSDGILKIMAENEKRGNFKLSYLVPRGYEVVESTCKFGILTIIAKPIIGYNWNIPIA